MSEGVQPLLEQIAEAQKAAEESAAKLRELLKAGTIEEFDEKLEELNPGYKRPTRES